MVRAGQASERAKNKALHDYELAKAYPQRYPHNGDSIGIEVVGDYLGDLDKKDRAFVPPTQAQRESVAKLVEALKTRFGLKNEDVYHHADISYKDKNRTEGKGLGY